MFFTIIERHSRIPVGSKSQVFLRWDDWNDYSYYTLFGILYIDEKGSRTELGAVKIGFFGQNENQKKLRIGDSFNSIDPEHFSVGTDVDYYVALNKLGSEVRDKILHGLNDIAKNEDLFNSVIDETVFKVSFLRGLSQTTIEGQFKRLTEGKARLTPYHFSYTTPLKSGITPMTLHFNVEPFSNPPTNIHILVGRNGVGKTFMINNMINCLTKPETKNRLYGEFISVEDDETDEEGSLFANLICVTFSAFDEFKHPPEQKDKSLGIQYSYIGLKTIQTDGTASETIDPAQLIIEFLKSIKICKNTNKSARWKTAIGMLDTDPIFRSSNVAAVIEFKNDIEMNSNAEKLFKKLSTGHKLILLTITRLVEKLEERSLVLIDEPESHLHPPLLSSFMRALTEILIDRNAVSIIATHSPVVLQEVPKSCVWKLLRTGTKAKADRLQIESFGENVGVLTQEVFGLEVTDSGFNRILKKLVNENNSYEKAMSSVNDQLGIEARAILRTLFYQKKKAR